MNNEEALEILKALNRITSWLNKRTIWALELAEHALEKRIHLPVFQHEGGYYCPCCDCSHEYSKYDKEEIWFCPECGQAVKWESEDEENEC